jgi:GNAT superfamily N-acetyltransferase
VAEGEDELVGRWRRSQVAGYATMTATGGGEARVLAGGAVHAFRVPAMPRVAVFNGVLSRDVDALEGVLDELRAWYAGSAWLVWLASWQVEAGAPVLERHGLRLDETGRAMAAWLDDLDLAPRAELDLAPDGAVDELAAVLDAGFEMPDGLSFRPAFARTPPPALRTWVARVDGAGAAAAVSVLHDGDAWFPLVATRPEHRGRGLSGELLRTALRAARDAGCSSTSLEATADGRRVYRRLGFGDLGDVQLWEAAAREDG